MTHLNCSPPIYRKACFTVSPTPLSSLVRSHEIPTIKRGQDLCFRCGLGFGGSIVAGVCFGGGLILASIEITRSIPGKSSSKANFTVQPL
jgi:hypothetical protein